MIKYLTQIADEHILSVNSRNVKVTVTNNPRRYKFDGVTVYSNFDIESYKQPFTKVVLAVELAREVAKQLEIANEKSD